MISMEEHLISKINEGLSAIGLPIGLIDDFEKYLEQEDFEEEFLKSLPKMDFSKLSVEDLRKAGETYNYLKRHAKGVFLKKYISTLFQIGKGSVKVIIKAAEYYFEEKDANYLLEIGVDKALVTAIYSGYIACNEYRLNTSFFTFYNRMYKDDPSILEKASIYSDTNSKMCIVAMLLKNSEGGFSEQKKWLEKIIVNSIKLLFKNSISDQDRDECIKYIQGGFLTSSKVNDKLIENLKFLPIDNYILKLLVATNYLIFLLSSQAKRFFNLLIMIHYSETINTILAFNNYEDKFNVSQIESINKELKISPEYLIVWMADNVENNRLGLKAKLKEKLKSEKEAFKKAITIATSSSAVCLSRMLWDIGEGKEYVNLVEQALVKEFWELMYNNDLLAFDCAEFKAYLIGDKKLEEIIDTLRNSNTNSGIYHDSLKITNMFSAIRGVSSIYERGLVIFTYIGFYSVINSILRNLYDNGITDAYEDLIKILENNGVDIKYIVLFFAENTSLGTQNNKLYDNKSKVINYIIETYSEEVIACIKDCSLEGRIFLLDSLATYSLEKFSKTIIEYFNDTSKVVREKVLDILAGNLKNIDDIIPLLKSKKQNFREGAIRVIYCSEDPRITELLMKTLENEKSEKISNLIRKKLNMQIPQSEKQLQTSFEDLLKNILKGNKKSVFTWIGLDTLPKLRLINSEELAPEDLVKAIMVSYASNAYIKVSKEAEVIAKRLNPEDLANLCNEVFERWIALGAESKKKWVLVFCAIHGDFIMVKKLQKQIEEWPKSSRGAIACEAIRALALNGSSEALLIVDGISRKFKFRQVKEAATVALDFAAEEMGLDRETLSDRIVPNLGFDVRGERIFDFGERKYTACLTPELSIKIFDDKGKTIKTLPSPGKNDDVIKAKLASEEFKQLKKQLKTTSTIQQIRLEMALSMNRKWDKSSWVKLFVENPIMHQFAIGLVWGSYYENTLKETFRYMEDGTFNTKDEEEFEIIDKSLIGLIHPIELEQEVLDLWKEQFENYEVNQPFDQLNRKIYLANEEDKELKQVKRFKGILINGLSLMGKMTTEGWYKGSVLDGGGYYNFYKEDKNLGIGATLEFSGVSIGYENEEVTIDILTFYRAGTVGRGSYVYDKVKEEHLIKPLEVPERFFSEILYQVDKALVSKIGVNDSSKNEI